MTKKEALSIHITREHDLCNSLITSIRHTRNRTEHFEEKHREELAPIRKDLSRMEEDLYESSVVKGVLEKAPAAELEISEELNEDEDVANGVAPDGFDRNEGVPDEGHF